MKIKCVDSKNKEVLVDLKDLTIGGQPLSHIVDAVKKFDMRMRKFETTYKKSAQEYLDSFEQEVEKFRKLKVRQAKDLEKAEETLIKLWGAVK
jgi:hypothetical protein